MWHAGIRTVVRTDGASLCAVRREPRKALAELKGTLDVVSALEVSERVPEPRSFLGNIAVGTHIAMRPPHKSRRARFGHRASTLGE